VYMSKPGHRKSPPTITAETMARHDEKTPGQRRVCESDMRYSK